MLAEQMHHHSCHNKVKHHAAVGRHCTRNLLTAQSCFNGREGVLPADQDVVNWLRARTQATVLLVANKAERRGRDNIAGGALFSATEEPLQQPRMCMLALLSCMGLGPGTHEHTNLDSPLSDLIADFAIKSVNVLGVDACEICHRRH